MLCVAEEDMSAVDVVYLKNVLLKFIAAQSAGKTQVHRIAVLLLPSIQPCLNIVQTWLADRDTNVLQSIMRCCLSQQWHQSTCTSASLTTCGSTACFGGMQERDALLPAVATLLRATPAEFKALRSVVVEGGSWWPAMGF